MKIQQNGNVELTFAEWTELNNKSVELNLLKQQIQTAQALQRVEYLEPVIAHMGFCQVQGFQIGQRSQMDHSGIID